MPEKKEPDRKGRRKCARPTPSPNNGRTGPRTSTRNSWKRWSCTCTRRCTKRGEETRDVLAGGCGSDLRGTTSSKDAKTNRRDEGRKNASGRTNRLRLRGICKRINLHGFYWKRTDRNALPGTFRYDRDWKKIEAYVGTKTVIQVRANAKLIAAISVSYVKDKQSIVRETR